MIRVEQCDHITNSYSHLEEKSPPIVVLKFGGTALGTPARIWLAALRAKEQIKLGFLPIVVVSAKAKTTDRLLGELRAICRRKGEVGTSALREVDRALSTGETLSAALVAAAIVRNGVRAESVCANEAVLLAAGPYGEARLLQLRPGRIAELLARRIVPVVAGFQGVREDGELVTLGRGSSDVTAVFLASQLGAVSCHIVTDVSGVHEEDPRISPESPRYACISHERLVEITQRGAKVVHPEAARGAFADRVPPNIYHYRADLEQPEGTLVGRLQ